MILFIDDEPEYISPFSDAFAFSGFDVKIVNNVDSGWEFIMKNKHDVDAVILDIMMPPGRLLAETETKEGLRTGLRFIELMKTLDERIAIVCLTNADSKKFGRIDHANCSIYEKKDINPWQLVDKMSDIKRRKRL